MTREEIKELVALKCWAVEKTDGDVAESRAIGFGEDGKVLPLWIAYFEGLGLQGVGNTLLEAYREFQRVYYEVVAPKPRTVTDPREQAASSPENPENCQAKPQDPYAELLTRVERLEKMLTPPIERKEVDTSCQLNKDYYTK